jgi:hypothetical protein
VRGDRSISRKTSRANSRVSSLLLSGERLCSHLAALVMLTGRPARSSVLTKRFSWERTSSSQSIVRSPRKNPARSPPRARPLSGHPRKFPRGPSLGASGGVLSGSPSLPWPPRGIALLRFFGVKRRSWRLTSHSPFLFNRGARPFSVPSPVLFLSVGGDPEGSAPGYAELPSSGE